MSDLISRQAVIDMVKGWNLNQHIMNEEDALDDVKALPSAEPRKGKWIWNVNGMDLGLGAWTCSECKSKPDTWWESDRKINPLMCSGGSFCGNCGADMRGDLS